MRLLLGVTLAEMVVLAWIAETTSRKAGAWSGIRPKLTVPKAAAAPMARLFPLTLSAWALGGFYLSLMPSLVIEATGIRSPLVGAAVVSALMVSGGLSSLATRAFDAGKTVRASAALLADGHRPHPVRHCRRFAGGHGLRNDRRGRGLRRILRGVAARAPAARVRP